MADDNVNRSRLYRNRQDKMIAGVAGGLAQYFGVDPVLVRLAFVVLCFVPAVGGISVLAYIILAIVLPKRPLDESEPLSSHSVARGTSTAVIVFGLILIAVGALTLASNLGWFLFFPWEFFWPLLLIALGVLIILWRRD